MHVFFISLNKYVVYISFINMPLNSGFYILVLFTSLGNGAPLATVKAIFNFDKD